MPALTASASLLLCAQNGPMLVSLPIEDEGDPLSWDWADTLTDSALPGWAHASSSNADCTCVAFSDDGALVIAGGENALAVWRLDGGGDGGPLLAAKMLPPAQVAAANGEREDAGAGDNTSSASVIAVALVRGGRAALSLLPLQSCCTVWSVATGAELHRLTFAAAPTALAVCALPAVVAAARAALCAPTGAAAAAGGGGGNNAADDAYVVLALGLANGSMLMATFFVGDIDRA